MEQKEAPSFIYNSKETIEKTKRPIKRGGIHYYNYYTLPSPKGYVAPVLIDILCPKNKLPVLNNGHLEHAITINLGPGNIYGRWGENIKKKIEMGKDIFDRGINYKRVEIDSSFPKYLKLFSFDNQSSKK